MKTNEKSYYDFFQKFILFSKYKFVKQKTEKIKDRKSTFIVFSFF